ncbi:hypothetical protein [uncultured Phascolarctobacterium sp.]|jgi:hypothetical protein|uniref:hypothetical protein n=1 Tax=uncultured Phascolarctobacterium sp. TaxID=512296 RepID=UPI0025CD3C50|nr:hypothetical protein [uncultured Phascolarctobacterium sp.]
MSDKKETIFKVTSERDGFTVNFNHKVSKFDVLIGLTALVNVMITVLVDYGIKYENAEELIRKALDAGFETYADDIRGEKERVE